MVAFRKAERRKAKMRLGIAGASGSGKTASALLIAHGLCGDWAKIGVIDTENGSAELYVGATIGGVRIGQYNVLTISAPYMPTKYTEAIRAAEDAGLEVVIVDSLSHAWAGEGGILDRQGKIADRGTNSFAAWRTVTPEHNALVEAMLQSGIHVIATLRTKAEYVLEMNDKGKQVPRKIGMAPIQREGMEYEFTLFFELDEQHVAKTSKDRTNLFDGQFFVPVPKTGTALKDWLETGIDEPAPPPMAEAEPQRQPQVVPTNGTLFGKASANFTAFWQAARKLGFSSPDVLGFAGGDIKGYTQEQLDKLLADLQAVRAKEAAGNA